MVLQHTSAILDQNVVFDSCDLCSQGSFICVVTSFLRHVLALRTGHGCFGCCASALQQNITLELLFDTSLASHEHLSTAISLVSLPPRVGSSATGATRWSEPPRRGSSWRRPRGGSRTGCCPRPSTPGTWRCTTARRMRSTCRGRSWRWGAGAFCIQIACHVDCRNAQVSSVSRPWDSQALQ